MDIRRPPTYLWGEAASPEFWSEVLAAPLASRRQTFARVSSFRYCKSLCRSLRMFDRTWRDVFSVWWFCRWQRYAGFLLGKVWLVVVVGERFGRIPIDMARARSAGLHPVGILGNCVNWFRGIEQIIWVLTLEASSILFM